MSSRRSLLPITLSACAALAGCGGRVVVQVELTGLEAGARALAATVTKDGAAALPLDDEVSGRPDSIGLDLPAGTAGRIGIELDVFTDDTAQVASVGRGEVTVAGEGLYRTTVPLSQLTEARTPDETERPEAAKDNWYAAWAASVADVWLVGSDGVMHGPPWQQMDKAENLRAVWGSGPEDIWVAGRSGVLRHWNGSTWEPADVTTEPRPDLLGLWGPRRDEVWAVGRGGTVLRFDGTRWAPVSSGTAEDLFAVSGSRGEDAWAVGRNGTILHWNGASWSGVQSEGSDLYAVWAASEQAAWAVGASGTIRRWDGTAWRREPSGTDSDLFGLSGSEPGDVWAVGDQGTVLHRDGAGWHEAQAGTMESLPLQGAFGIAGRPGAWVAGAKGEVRRYRARYPRSAGM